MSELVKKTDNYEHFIIPEVDTYEVENEYILKASMPGVSKDDLDILLEDDRLTITGKVQKENNDNLVYQEYQPYSYKRSFRVGRDINRDQISAKINQGVLTLILAKAEEVKPRKINIELED